MNPESYIGRQFSYLKTHPFIKNVLTLQVGSFAGTLFQAVVGVLLARIFQPELFGIYTLAFSLAGLGGIMLGAGIQEAAATVLGSAYARKNPDDICEALAFLIKITIYTGILTLIGVLFLPLIAKNIYGNSSIGFYAGIVIAGVFLSSSFTAVVQLGLQVVGRIKLLTAVVFSDLFLRFSASLILAFLGFGVLGAIIGQFIGAAILFVASFFIWNKIEKSHTDLPSLRELFYCVKRVSIRKHLGFSFWVAIDRNMGNLFMALPLVLTGIYVSAGEVSFFKLAFGFVNLALSLLGPISVLLNIEFPKMQVGDPSRMRQNFIRVSLYGLLLSSVLTVGVIVVSPLAFRILYGESFLPSVSYVSGLFIFGALYGIGVGLGPMWRAINKVKVSIAINLVVLGVGIPLGLWLIKTYGLWGAVIMVTLWFASSHLASFIYLSKKLR